MKKNLFAVTALVLKGSQLTILRKK